MMSSENNVQLITNYKPCFSKCNSIFIWNNTIRICKSISESNVLGTFKIEWCLSL